MKKLRELLEKLPDYEGLVRALESGASPALLSGMTAASRALLAATLYGEQQRPLVLVCADEREANALLPDLAALTGQQPVYLPAREFSFHPGTVSRGWEHRRLGYFHALLQGEIPLLVLSIEALLQRTLPPECLKQASRTLCEGGSHRLEDLVEHLIALGYERADQVEGVGQFALRGGILDIFSPGEAGPIRAEFWGEEIDSLSSFDPLTQRRLGRLKKAQILPASELIFLPPEAAGGVPDLFLPRIYQKICSAADYLPPDALLLLCESPRLTERARGYLWQLEEDVKSLIEEGKIPGKHAVFAYTQEQLYGKLEDFPFVYLDAFVTSSFPLAPRSLHALTCKQLPGMSLSQEAVEEDLFAYRRAGYRVVLLCESQRRADALQAALREKKLRVAVDYGLHALPRQGDIILAVGNLSAGLEFPEGKFAILSEGNAVLPARVQKKAPAKSGRERIESFSDLSPGDLVVHEHHGVARFAGMMKMPVEGMERDYVKLAFLGADVLYVPAMQLDLVSKYIGSGEGYEGKKLSKLGGTEWERTRSRAKKAAKDLAKGLIQLYAARQRSAGHAFAPDSPWQREFEDQFPYPETDDQLRCAQEIKQDMERSLPMDRLLCGDVGYGKTEVALRAVMKCILEGKQAAILAPTTVLAQQHYLTAKSRFRHFPVSIELVSRARTAAQSKDILRRAAEGKLDLLIGTHKLLSKSTKFHDIGLLIVDEEQRFGVSQKERLKELFPQVDVLVLSATPIPRTLNMALSGLRDMSTLEEPPPGRRPVQTYVLEHDWGVLAEAMRRELERGGQVFYLHNRTESIDSCAARLLGLLPEARIATAHGRMAAEEVDEIMRQMRDNELDILVCTTIIETGVDLPNVNTLIIEDADHLGLSQLHQLRGRVGRSSRRAFAYMSYRRGKVLSEVAERRLSAVREFAAFGSGFKIAMRDLEIRGAGNLLGPEQSGFITGVGYDMYLRLLEEAVLEERGETPKRPPDCSADLSVAASIPDSYVPSPEQRMDVYRRIARIRSEEMADEMLEELIDRYGDPPPSVNNLISIALLRCLAASCGIREITQKERLVRFSLPQPDLARVFALCGQEKYKGRLLFSAGEKPHLALRFQANEDILRLARLVLNDFIATAQVES